MSDMEKARKLAMESDESSVECLRLKPMMGYYLIKKCGMELFVQEYEKSAVLSCAGAGARWNHMGLMMRSG